MGWQEVVGKWCNQYRVRARPPLAGDEIRRKLELLDIVNNGDLLEFYTETNGLSYGWLNIFPFLDRRDAKHTWESIEHVNSPSRSNYLGGSLELHSRFLIFGTVGAGEPAVMDRNEGTIWYGENGELHQTDMSLEEFIQECLREVHDFGSPTKDGEQRD